MEWFINVAIFSASCGVLYLSGELVISSLVRFSRFLGLKEFVVAFFVMAFAASLPNLFVGITSALAEIPQLSLGDIFGNNFTALTLAVAAAIIFSPQKEIQIESQTIKNSSIFAIFTAILPVVLLIDGVLSRIDGVVLICFFVFYVGWLFSKKERFSKVYKENERGLWKNILKESVKNALKALLGIILVFIAAKGIVSSSSFFAFSFKLPISLIGLLIVGFGNALPEVYFSITSARRGETFMILGNLLGSIVIPATVVLGIVSLIHPIVIESESFLVVSRFFMIAAALFFLIFSKTHNTISKKEGIFLFILYVIFVFSLISFF
ncbi:MAG: sodium:calcium antiporter [Candidatus Zambryskibacteria bacterium]|nr:sodium:calcium antiporter [Candidatus Zambryskibacteria bacterium]